MTPTFRLARWHWRVSLRQGWRRPPYHGPVSLLLGAGFLAVLLYLSTHRDQLGPFTAAPALLAAGAVARLFLGIQQGAQVLRRNLLADRILPLVYGAPQPPTRWLASHLLHRAGSAAVAALWVPAIIALLGGEPVAQRLLLWAPLAWLAALVAGAGGLALGALSIIWLARRWPRDLSFVVLLLQLMQVGGGAWFLITAARTGAPAPAARILLLLPAALLGLPGLWLAMRWAVGRADLGQQCHEAWLALRTQAGAGPSRSLALPRDLLALWRNPIGKYRIAMAVVFLAAAPYLGRLIPGDWHMATALGLWLINAGEWAMAAFSGEGAALSWYMLAPVSPGRVLSTKWLGHALVPAAHTALVAALLALGGGRSPALPALLAGAVSLGAGSLQLGLTACSAHPVSALTGQDNQLAAWVGEQVARTTGAFAGYALGSAYLAAAVWHLAPVSALVLVPPVALLLGLWRLRATWMPLARKRMV